MKFTKAIVMTAAVLALAVPVMASNCHAMEENSDRNTTGYFSQVDNGATGQQLLARRGGGNGGGNGAGNGAGHRYGAGDGSGRSGSSYGTSDRTGQRGGNGPGDGTGNGGSGPRDGNGNGQKTGDCPQTQT